MRQEPDSQDPLGPPSHRRKHEPWWQQISLLRSWLLQRVDDEKRLGYGTQRRTMV